MAYGTHHRQGSGGPSRQPNAGSGNNPLGTLLVIGAAAAVAVGLGLWVAGGMAMAVTGHPWPKLSWKVFEGALVGAFTHGGHPGRSWPAPYGAAMPAAAIYWLFVALELAVLGTIVVLVVRRMLNRSQRGNTVWWARPADLGQLIVKRPPANRVILGRLRGTEVAAAAADSVAVVGVTGMGKTVTLAVPAALRWTQGPRLVTSVKVDDQIRDTQTHARSLGQVQIFDPSGSYPGERARWSPLSECGHPDHARRTVAGLVDAVSYARSDRQDPFWRQAAVELLAPLFHAAALDNKTMRDLLRWVSRRTTDEALAVLQAHGVVELADGLRGVLRTEDPRTLGNVWATVQGMLSPYREQSVLQATEATDIDLDRFLAGTNTLYLVAPLLEQARFRPIFEALIRALLGRAERLAMASPTGSLPLPLLLLLDEAANFAALSDLDHVVSTCRSLGITVVTIWQDVAQVRARYGDRADTILSNHKARLLFGASGDPATLQWASGLIGQEERGRWSTSIGASGERSRTHSVEQRQLVPTERLRQLGWGHAVLIYANLPPAELTLRHWREDRALRRLTEPPAAAAAGGR